jgi:hypothetical protein
MNRLRLWGIGVPAAALLIGTVAAQVDDLKLLPLDDPAIEYNTGLVNDSVAALERRIASGSLRLTYGPEHGYLEAVLAALKVPVSSQVLVFSKTSFQASKIGPPQPRAIYHAPSVSVGYVQGGDVLEFAAVDPRQGVIFYSLDQEQAARPAFTRRGECIQCHWGAATLGVPGLVVRSVPVERSGVQILTAKSYITDHRSPLEQRWGGWYVSGSLGSQRHMGNRWVERNGDPGPELSVASIDHSLRRVFDAGMYLTPHSDVVSLMVLEHQTRITNLLTRLGWETRIALTAGTPLDRIDPLVEETVKYMLFTDEAKLTAPVQGDSKFAEEFAASGPRDRRGRSLRQFDLTSRIFRYPCSFMIDEPVFAGLPAQAKSRLYRRLWQVLSGEDESPAFARLTREGRESVLQILLDTHPDLPEFWRVPRTPRG